MESSNLPDPERVCAAARRAVFHGDAPLDIAMVSSREEHASAHMRACAACARWLASVARQVAVLGVLQRAVAPSELDVRVAASFDSASRRVRALDALRRLARLVSPAELDGAVERGAHDAADAGGGRSSHSRAPAVLERLVTEELADPAKARSRRFVGGLRRMRAPDQLDGLVALDLLQPKRSRANRVRAFTSLALAAALLTAVVGPLVWSAAQSGARASGELNARRYPFRVEPAGAEALLDVEPSLRELLDGYGSGIMRAHGI